MLLRYLCKQMLMPPGVLLLLLGLAWWLRCRRPRLAGGCLAVGALGLWAMCTPWVVQHAARVLEREPVLAPEAWPTLAGQAQAIVVLGAGRERGDPAWPEIDQPSAYALERLRYAARLARASGLPVLASGGLHYGAPPSEAQIMANSLQTDFGVTVKWQEGRSRTTWENAQFSAQLLREQGVRRVVLVTQAWHMPRARWSFEQAGIEVVPAPMGFISDDYSRPFGGWLPESRAMAQSGALLNEFAGWVGYRLFY